MGGNSSKTNRNQQGSDGSHEYIQDPINKEKNENEETLGKSNLAEQELLLEQAKYKFYKKYAKGKMEQKSEIVDLQNEIKSQIEEELCEEMDYIPAEYPSTPEIGDENGFNYQRANPKSISLKIQQYCSANQVQLNQEKQLSVTLKDEIKPITSMTPSTSQNSQSFPISKLQSSSMTQQSMNPSIFVDHTKQKGIDRIEQTGIDRTQQKGIDRTEQKEIDRTQQKGFDLARGPNPKNILNNKFEKVAQQGTSANKNHGDNIQTQFFLSFKEDQGKEFGLICRVLQNAQLCVEDANQTSQARQQYFIELKQEFPKMLSEVMTDECMRDSTQRMVRREVGGYMDIFIEWSIPSDSFSILKAVITSTTQTYQVKQIERLSLLFIPLLKELVQAKNEGGRLINSICKNDPRISKETGKNEGKKSKQNMNTKSDSGYMKNLKKFNKDSSQYHFLNQLGKGGQGEVWLYFDEESKNTMVFKKYADDQFESYLNEKKILLKLKDANRCPPILSCDDSNLTIQTGKGEASLRQYDDYLKQNTSKMYKQSELLYILHWLVSAVDNLSKDYGIYHCDIKPDNIVLVPTQSKTYQIQLIDFGGSVYKWEKYPGCYTPAFMNEEIFTIQESDLSIDVCVQFELYCVARTICKLALKDVTPKKFQTEPFLKLIEEINVWKKGKYSEIALILRDIANKNSKTCEQVLSRIDDIYNRNHKNKDFRVDSIPDKNKLVQKIQQKQLLAAQKNMTSEYLQQQITFYEQLFDYKRCIEIINIILSPKNKHAQGLTNEEKRELILKKIRFESETNGERNIIIQMGISSSKEIFKKEKNSDFLEFILMVSDLQENRNQGIDNIIQKGTSIIFAQKQLQNCDLFIVITIQNILASYLESANRFSEAIPFRERNLEIAQQLDQSHDQENYISIFQALTQLADCFNKLGRFVDALRFYQLALESAQGKEDTRNIANALQNIAMFYMKNSEVEKAFELQQQVLGKRIIGTAEFADSLSKFASIKVKLGHYNEVIEIYQNLLTDLKMNFGSLSMKYAFGLYNKSICYQQLGKLLEASFGYEEAYLLMSTNSGISKSIIVEILINLCDCFRGLNNSNLAKSYAKLLLKISSEQNAMDSLTISHCYEKVALIYIDNLKYSKAIKILEKALSIRQLNVSLPNQPIKGYSLTSNQSEKMCQTLKYLALANEGLGNYDDSVKFQLESLQLLLEVFKTQDHPEIAIQRGNLGITYLKQKRFKESKFQLELAVASLQKASSNIDSFSSYLVSLEEANAILNPSKLDES